MRKREKRRDRREYGIRWIAGKRGKVHVDEVVGADSALVTGQYRSVVMCIILEMEN
jgi:hypothetical protein